MHESHGNSVAAWTGTIVILIGATLVCLGIMFANSLFWIPGIVGIVAGVVAWVVLERNGYGEKPHDHEANGVR